MHEIYSDDYASAAGGRPGSLIPEPVRRAAGAVVFVGLIAAMGLWAYRLGTRDAAEVPIIRAMEGPARVQPDDPGGERAAHQGYEVNTVLSGTPAPVPRATPAVPDPVDGTPLAEEDAPRAELAARTEATEPAPGEVLETVGPAPDLLVDGAPGPAEGAAPTDTGSAVAAAVAAAAAEAEAAAQADADAADDADGEPPAAGLRPRSRPTGRSAPRAAAQPTEPAAATQATRQAAVEPPAREVGSVSSGARLVQLGAFDNAEVTRAAWETLVVRHGDLLSDKSLYVERTTSNARVFYRLRVAGFDSSDETRQMCEALRSRGVDCIPVTLQ